MGSENEMVLENAPLLPKKSIVFHENDFTGVLGIIVECNNPQRVSEINFWPATVKIASHRCSVTLCLTLRNPMDCTRLPCPSPTPGVYSNSSPLSW